MRKIEKKKFKINDLVRIDPPMLGRIKRVYKDGGYSVEVFASPSFEIARYGDDELYKVPKDCEWVKSSLVAHKRISEQKS